MKGEKGERQQPTENEYFGSKLEHGSPSLSVRENPTIKIVETSIIITKRSCRRLDELKQLNHAARKLQFLDYIAVA